MTYAEGSNLPMIPLIFCLSPQCVVSDGTINDNTSARVSAEKLVIAGWIHVSSLTILHTGLCCHTFFGFEYGIVRVTLLHLLCMHLDDL